MPLGQNEGAECTPAIRRCSFGTSDRRKWEFHKYDRLTISQNKSLRNLVIV